jgi:rare lipoprotein A
MAAGSLVIVAGTALALFAEQPVQAAESLNVYSSADEAFENAFEHYEMQKHEVAPSPAAVLAAETRFASAPVEEEATVIAVGMASFYGSELAGRRTASGERFNPADLTAAHRTLPFGTRIRVTNPGNGQSVVVRINDRGPFHGNRLIDLSREAAERIGLVRAGSGRVELALQSS